MSPRGLVISCPAPVVPWQPWPILHPCHPQSSALFVSLRGDFEDPHRPLVVSRWYAARLRHHQRLPGASHGAAHLHRLRLPHREVLPLPQGRREAAAGQLCIIHQLPRPADSQRGAVIIRRVMSSAVNRGKINYFPLHCIKFPSLLS